MILIRAKKYASSVEMRSEERNRLADKMVGYLTLVKDMMKVVEDSCREAAEKAEVLHKNLQEYKRERNKQPRGTMDDNIGENH
jgi:hypothetical protein